MICLFSKDYTWRDKHGKDIPIVYQEENPFLVTVDYSDYPRVDRDIMDILRFIEKNSHGSDALVITKNYFGTIIRLFPLLPAWIIQTVPDRKAHLNRLVK